MAKREIRENISVVELRPQTHKLSVRVIIPKACDIDPDDSGDCGVRITTFTQSSGGWDDDENEDESPTDNESYKKSEVYVRLSPSEMKELGDYLVEQSKELSARIKAAEKLSKRGKPPEVKPPSWAKLKKGKRNGLTPRSR